MDCCQSGATLYPPPKLSTDYFRKFWQASAPTYTRAKQDSGQPGLAPPQADAALPRSHRSAEDRPDLRSNHRIVRTNMPTVAKAPDEGSGTIARSTNML